MMEENYVFYKNLLISLKILESDFPTEVSCLSSSMNPGEIEMAYRVQDEITTLIRNFVKWLPDGREATLANLKLEEASFWATRAISVAAEKRGQEWSEMDGT